MSDYAILLAPLVVEDLRALDTRDVRRVLDAIAERLTRQPEFYGKPLGGKLAGLRRVRVGDIRVVYRVRPGQVDVLIVQLRKDVYGSLDKRLDR